MEFLEAGKLYDSTGSARPIVVHAERAAITQLRRSISSSIGKRSFAPHSVVRIVRRDTRH